MSLYLYDSLAKKERELVPLEPGVVRMYTCGPTVYGRPHIGNYSSFLMADLLRRWLEAGHGLKVIHVKNITDVGHLVRDADTGEDKIEKQAKEEHGTVTMESVLKVARTYEAQYLEDEAALNLVEPEHRPRATEYVSQMKEMTESLLKSGHAYVTDDGIYFDITSPTPTPYGALSGNSVDSLSAGARVDVNEAKRNPADFALWKFCVGQNEHHVLRWQSPRGPAGETYAEGFPGWHIECSAMSRTLLGDTLDVHTGGEDNIFPHHECEIAQSECVTGKPFVKLWIHKRRIDLAGEKMSKSLGNVITIPYILEKGLSPLDLRFYFLSVHYRTNLKFSWEGLEEAHHVRRGIMEWMEKGGAGESVPAVKPGHPLPEVTVAMVTDLERQFDAAMDQDLNVSAALAAVHACKRLTNFAASLPAPETREALEKFIKKIRHTFGCFDAQAQSIPADIQQLIDARAAARAAKDFAASDRLRAEIETKGYEVRDTKGEQVVKKK